MLGLVLLMALVDSAANSTAAREHAFATTHVLPVRAHHVDYVVKDVIWSENPCDERTAMALVGIDQINCE